MYKSNQMQTEEVEGLDKSQTQHPSINLDITIPSLEDLEKLQGMEPGFSLTPRYRSTDDWAKYKDEEIRALYLGTKQVPNEKEELITYAFFSDKTGIWLAAQMVLVESVRDLPFKTPIAITYEGRSQNKSNEGMTCKFLVQQLR